MEKTGSFLNKLVDQIMAGEIVPWLKIICFVFVLRIFRKIWKWIVKKYSGFMGIVGFILLVLLIYGLYDRPEEVKALFGQLAMKVEQLFSNIFG